MSNLQKELQDLASKHMPQVMAGELQKFLKESEENLNKLQQALKANEILKSDMEKLQENWSLLHRRTQSTDQLKTLENALNERELIITKKELAYDKKIAVIEAIEANKRADSIQDLAKTVFSNQQIVINRSTAKSKTIPTTDNCGYSTTQTISETETETEVRS